ncbi:hypothetical protein AB7M23_002725 [Pseudomonas sp. HLS-6 TE3448]
MRTVWRLLYTQDVGTKLRKCRNILTKARDKRISRDYTFVGAGLAYDRISGVSARTQRLPHLLATRSFCRSKACLRWLRWGFSESVVPASGASAVFVGAGLPAMASVGCQRVRGACLAGKPGSYRLARALLELACLRWRRWGVSEYAAFASRASPAPTGCRLACDGFGGDVSECAAFASRASPAPTGRWLRWGAVDLNEKTWGSHCIKCEPRVWQKRYMLSNQRETSGVSKVMLTMPE